MRKTAAARLSIAALSLAALGITTPALAAGPDLRLCPEVSHDEEASQRSTPLPVPRALRNVVASDLDRLAVVTLTGATHCIAASYYTTAEGMRLTPGGRFLSFSWTGYEAYGHVVVDRTGAGLQIETGEPPVFSPSGRRLAALQVSGSGFGGLEGFGVWQVTDAGLDALALIEAPALADWRIDGWIGEDCIEASGVPDERIPQTRDDFTGVRRDRYVARAS